MRDFPSPGCEGLEIVIRPLIPEKVKLESEKIKRIVHEVKREGLRLEMLEVTG